MQRLLKLINPESRRKRLAIKLAIVLVVGLFVLYPNPALLVRHVARGFLPNELIAPENPKLDELDRELTKRLAESSQPNAASQAVRILVETQRLVYQRVPYQYDWENWGCANYFPTVDEVMDRGRSDCKGRAVVAASLLARHGVKSRLVSDLSHVWVWTPEGETMSPIKTASGRKVLTADQRGSRVDVLALVVPGGLLADLPLRIGYGIAIFPPVRVFIIALTLWFVSLARTPVWGWAAVGLWALFGAWMCFRVACENIHFASVFGAWSGIALCVLGLILARR